MFSLSRLLTGRASKEERAAVDREILEHKGAIRNSVQAIQAGNRILESLSGTMELNRSVPHENREQ